MKLRIQNLPLLFASALLVVAAGCSEDPSGAGNDDDASSFDGDPGDSSDDVEEDLRDDDGDTVGDAPQDTGDDAPDDTAEDIDVESDAGGVPDGTDATDPGDASDSGDTEDDAAPDASDTADSTDTVDSADSADSTEASPDVEPDVPGPQVDPYAVGDHTVTVYTYAIDVGAPGGGFGGGGGEIDVDIYLPQGAQEAPVLVFAPGFQINADSFAWVGEHLGSHGYAVLIPTFGDSAFSAFDHSDLADYIIKIIDWVVSENTLVGLFGGHADLTRIAAGGHSRGGKATILAATRDSRIRASFNLDPVDVPPPNGIPIGPPPTPTPENPSVTPELMGSFTIPGAFVGSTLGGDGALGAACAPVDDNYQQYYDHAAGARVVYLPPDSGHNDFADPVPILVSFACAAGGDASGLRSWAGATMLSFYKLLLEGDTRYRPWVDGAAVPGGTTVTSDRF